jgi:hypothetical protein
MRGGHKQCITIKLTVETILELLPLAALQPQHIVSTTHVKRIAPVSRHVPPAVHLHFRLLTAVYDHADHPLCVAQHRACIAVTI